MPLGQSATFLSKELVRNGFLVLKSSKPSKAPPDLKLHCLCSRTNGVQCCQRSNQTSSKAGNWKFQIYHYPPGFMVDLWMQTKAMATLSQLFLHNNIKLLYRLWHSDIIWHNITMMSQNAPNISYHATKPCGFGTRTTCTTCVLCTNLSCQSWFLSAWTNHAPNRPSQGQTMARYSAVAASTNTLIWISRTFAQYRPEHFIPVETWRLIVWPHESWANSMPKWLKK